MSAPGGPVWGVQEPRFEHRPDSVVVDASVEAIELAAEVGMPLDPWQQRVLQTWLGVREDGRWAASTAGVVVARQNGKNAILEARELAGLFLFGEQRIVHSAHEAGTAEEAFKRMAGLIESVPWLDAEVAKMPKSPGRFSIVLRSGAELSYRTRTKSGGRGFSAPVVILDEAQQLTGAQVAAIQPLVSSFPSHQLIYTGTVLAGATVFQGFVERGRQRVGERLGYDEWSAPEDMALDAVEGWLMANPSVGYRMTLEAIEDEWESFSSAKALDKFAEERLSIWPDVEAVGSVIPVQAWSRCLSEWRPDRAVTGGVVAVAVSMRRDYAVVGYAVPSERGVFVDVVAETGERFPDGSERADRFGIDWVLPYLVGLQERRRPIAVVVDKAGPAFPLVNAFVAARLPVRVSEFGDWKSACAQFVDAVSTRRIEHAGQVRLTEAAQGVQRRVLTDAWVYDRKTPGVQVAPLEAVTLAAWGLQGGKRPSKYDTEDLLVLG